MLGRHAQAEISDRRAAQVQRDAADLRVEAAEHQRTVELAELRISEISDTTNDLERQIDRFDDQTRMLDEAARKLVEADVVRNDASLTTDEMVTRSASLEVEAEDLLVRVRAIEVTTDELMQGSGRELRLPDLSPEPPAPAAPAATAPAGDDLLGIEPQPDSGGTTVEEIDQAVDQKTPAPDAASDAAPDELEVQFDDATISNAIDATASEPAPMYDDSSSGLGDAALDTAEPAAEPEAFELDN